jgi:hypothetical protein
MAIKKSLQHKTSNGFGVVEALIIIVVAAIIGFLIYFAVNTYNAAQRTAAEIAADEAKRSGDNSENPLGNDLQKDAKFITSIPFEYAQVDSLSKYRSCSGHDYSGMNIDGIEEKLRSMKHYINTASSLTDPNDKLKVFAPFDGTVKTIAPIKDFGRSVILSPDSAKGWNVEFGHIDTINTLAEGMKIKAGQLIGYGAIGPDGRGTEITVWNPGKKTDTAMHYGLDSALNHLSASVETEFAEHGLTAKELIISKEFRDEHACELSGTENNGSAVFAGNNRRDDIVLVK